MKHSLHREHARLSRAFGAALVVLAPTAAIEACSTKDAPEMVSAVDAESDHTVKADSPNDANSAADTIDATFDANCYSIITLFDAGAYADDSPGCEYTVSCGLTNHLATIGCQLYVTDEFGPDSIAPLTGCFVNAASGCVGDAYAPDAAITFDCIDCIGSAGGRRPAGLRKMRAPTSANELARYLATMAHDEAASVHAFARLSRELAIHGAPNSLKIAADRALRDEARHAQMVSKLALARGAKPRAPRFPRTTSPTKNHARGLVAIARENAVAGCVNEAFGALMAHVQATRATDPTLRRTFARIAKDETRHAALSFAVANWIEPRLDSKARARIETQKVAAAEKLDHALLARGEKNYDALLGRPSAKEARTLLHAMTRELARSA